eukprot:411817-Amphidinium_carterae.1
MMFKASCANGWAFDALRNLRTRFWLETYPTAPATHPTKIPRQLSTTTRTQTKYENATHDQNHR